VDLCRVEALGAGPLRGRLAAGLFSDGEGPARAPPQVDMLNSADGLLKQSWGEQRSGPGQFALPHDVWVDPRDRVLVCDRENARVEMFSREGAYTGEWPGLANPMQISIRDDILYLAESNQRVSILTLDGGVLARWGSRGEGQDQFTNAPHSICVDSRGDIYVSEVVQPNNIQKYTRRRTAS
jgi:hypothetical protein